MKTKAVYRRICKRRGHSPSPGTIKVTGKNERLAKCVNCELPYSIDKQEQKVSKKPLTLSFEEACSLVNIKRPISKYTFYHVLTVSAFFIVNTANAAELTANPSHDAQLSCNPACGYLNWSDLRNAPSVSQLVTTGNTHLVSANQSAFAEMYGARSIFCFSETNDLPDDATINSVTLDIVADSGFPTSTDRDYVVVPAAPANPASIVQDDWNNVTFTAASNRLDDSAFTNGAATAFDLNSTGLSHISKTGTTCFAVIEANHDLDNTTPPDVVNVNFRTADYTGTGSDPLLTIDYTAPVASSSASSAASSIPTGTGALNSTGSLLITTWVCDEYVDVYSASGVVTGQVCASGSTSVKIPAINFFVESQALMASASAKEFISKFLAYGLLLLTIRWFWRLLTQRRS